jgi:hypothetical protein
VFNGVDALNAAVAVNADVGRVVGTVDDVDDTINESRTEGFDCDCPDVKEVVAGRCIV